MKKYLILALIFLNGCAAVNIKKDLFGMSVQDVQSEKNSRQVMAAQDAKTSFDKVSLFIDELKASVSKREEKNSFIVGYNFNRAFRCINTSEVAFFIKPAQNNGSEITVYSDNTYLMDFVAEKLGEYIKK